MKGPLLKLPVDKTYFVNLLLLYLARVYFLMESSLFLMDQTFLK